MDSAGAFACPLGTMQAARVFSLSAAVWEAGGKLSDQRSRVEFPFSSSSLKRLVRPGRAGHSCKPSAWEAKAGR